MFGKIVIVVFAWASVSSLGCVQVYDAIDNTLIDLKHCKVSRKSWKRHEDYWANEIHNKDFGRGFRAGYYAVMQGKGTRPPTLPPRRYWSACNMKEDCRERTLAWFNGYSAGANVAVGDGVENLCRITTAEQLYKKPPAELPVIYGDEDSIQPEPVPPQELPEIGPIEESVPTPKVIPPAPGIEKIQYIPAPPVSQERNVGTGESQYLQTLDLFEHGTKLKKMNYQIVDP